jgi:hypothetical protein
MSSCFASGLNKFGHQRNLEVRWIPNLNIKELKYLKDQVKESLGIVYETKKKHGNVNGDQNLTGATFWQLWHLMLRKELTELW